MSSTSSKTYQNLPVPTSPHLAANIKIRPATTSDSPAMARCFFNSFTPSHPFWNEFPFDPWYGWWVDAWAMGIDSDPTTRTYIAIDTAAKRDGQKGKEGEASDGFVDGGKVVGFTRWIVPQADGNLERKWPDLPQKNTDLEGVMYPFFAGMEENRKGLMGVEPHWFLEMLGTDQSYQRTGIGHAFVKWGCDLADAEDMRVYIDASEKGAPFYQKYFSAVKTKLIPIPDKPSTFGHFEYWTHVVPKKSVRDAEIKAGPAEGSV